MFRAYITRSLSASSCTDRTTVCILKKTVCAPLLIYALCTPVIVPIVVVVCFKIKFIFRFGAENCVNVKINSRLRKQNLHHGHVGAAGLVGFFGLVGCNGLVGLDVEELPRTT